MNLMIARRDAAQAAITRFRGRVLRWGRDDCARMTAFVRRKLKRPVNLAKAGSYSSAAGAVRALKRMGHASLEAALDAQGLIRITPAAALPADVLAVPGEGGLAALWVYLGNGRALGWHEDCDDCCVVEVDLSAVTAAWSIL